MPGSPKPRRKAENGPALDYLEIGKRLRKRRLQFGLSTEALAARAGVARYTIVRLEQGQASTPNTLRKVTKALRLWSDHLTRPADTDGPFQIHRKEQTRWCVSIPKHEYQHHNVEQDRIHVDDESERKRLGSNGFQAFFTAVLETSHFGGGMEQAMMELHQTSWVDEHYGEEFVYCLQGSVTITVQDKPCVLNQGDALSFDATLPHQYEPTNGVGPKDEPPKILIVVMPRSGDPIGKIDGRPRLSRRKG